MYVYMILRTYIASQLNITTIQLGICNMTIKYYTAM